MIKIIKLENNKELKPTDLEAFIAVYKQFGIEVKTTINDKLQTEINLGGWGDENITDDDRFTGYSGFFSEVLFDENGKFIEQGFYE